MSWTLGDELREQGRAVVGALTVVGITFIYTMETWWHGWQLPVTTLLLYDVVGLALVLAVTRNIGFREDEQSENGLSGGHQESIRQLVVDFTELIFQSFLTGYLALFMLGIVKWGSPLLEIVRLGLILVVPLGFGAALTNQLLTGAGDEDEFAFPKNLAVFALGAVFLASTIAPTQEVEVVAAHAGWWRMSVIVIVSLVTAYLVLYELGLQGQETRVQRRSRITMMGTATMMYALAFVVTAALLAAFGHFSDAPFEVWVQETIVIAFPATIGAGAAEVII